LIFSTVVYAQAVGQVIRDGAEVRVYPSSAPDSIVIFEINRGDEVIVLDVVGDFYRVNIQNLRGVYIYRNHVRVTTTIGAPETNGVLVVATPDSQDILGVRDTGADLHVTGRYGDWYEVQLNGERGFVDGQLLDVPLSESLPDVRSAFRASGYLVEDIVAYAKTYLGVPYRFGSVDPARGFDCSGFVTVVMRRFGIYLQRTSASMAATNGFRVDRNALEPGDLVFFATGGGRRVSHVGIYIGDNQFIHSATIGGVIVSGMDEAYYRTRFVGANRVI
jgi:hypothetical protein